MSVQSPGRREIRVSDQRLPVRWAVIIVISTAVGYVVGAAEGLAAGVGAFCVTAGLLFKILK